MAPASAQHNAYAPGHALPQVQHHEWRTAANSAAHLIPHLETRAAQTPHLEMLDVGAGSGTITASLAKLIPRGQVVAVDISDEILERAKHHADTQGISNIRYQRASVYQLPFADSSFDVTHAHQVLTHLDAPVDAIREMLRVTKPGGIVSLREADLAMWCWWPQIPALEHFHDILVRSQVANGGSGTAGRQLLSWSMQAGARRDSVSVSFGTWCHGAPADREPWAEAMIERLRAGQMRTKAMELGLATEEDMDDMIEAWREWKRADDAVFGLMNGEAIVCKERASS
ncbi:hypothetical protein E4U41_007488 [Claviceps citrina]|nr:hypothetical protein E4U41_007488 [Claviceps citrina]